MSHPAQDFAEALDHFRADRVDAARVAVQRVLRRFPGDGPANHLLALIHVRQGHADRALPIARLAAAASPEDASIRNTLGLLHLQRRELDAAEAAFRESVRLDPALYPGRVGLARALLAKHDSAAAEQVIRAAAALRFDSGEHWRLLANMLIDGARAGEAVVELRRAIEARPNDLDLRGLLCLALHYPSRITPAEIASAHRAYGETADAQLGPAAQRDSFPNTREPDRRLRLGYVSPDLRAHSVAYFFEAVLERHDHDAVDVFCYSTSSHTDETTERLRAAADQWRDIGPRNEDGLSRAVREDAVDVLIDLCGHMKDHSLAALARRLAPVQLGWIGYPDVTGLRTMDGRLVDQWTDPPGAADLHADSHERLIRFDRCFLCYRPDPLAPEVGSLPADLAGHVTFGSFNAAAKISAACLDLWASVLRRVPGARLILKNDGLNDPTTRERIAAALESRGVDRGRIELVGYIGAVEGHLGLYHRVDVALDTYPYHGTTTTCEAMWMGVPVVTLAGETHAARVGVSLLHAAGLGELVARTPDQYATIAATLASETDSLRRLRAELRPRLVRSPLLDGASMARAVEHACRAAWREWCAGPGS